MNVTSQSDKASQTSRRKFLKRAWLPFALTLAALEVVVRAEIRNGLPWLINTALVIYVLGVIYCLVQTIGRLCLRQWKPSLWALARLIICVVVIVPASRAIRFNTFFGPSEDNFAKGLQIPENIEISVPQPKVATPSDKKDDYQLAILMALKSRSNGNSSIVPELASLRKLAENRPLLLRYLASHPGWRLFEERGALFATRRWKISGLWRMSLHGYYSSYDVDRWNSSESVYFQSRTTIGLTGKAWLQNLTGASWMDEGTNTQLVILGKDNGVDASCCMIRCSNLVVELFEQSRGAERRMTKAALKQIESEFSSIALEKEWNPSLLILEARRSGKPILELHEGFQTGIYDTEAWLNPREAGLVYLRAYEVTKGTELSTDRLSRASNERIGWSDNPDELFFYNTHITIYEGDWGDPYAARFEVWFKPDNSRTERKLFERVFKIEGWQR